jgi:signal transduction histidine kinase
VQFTREDLFRNIYPADGDLFLAAARELEEGKNEFQLEYRVLSNEGNIRWIHSRGKVESLDGSRIIRGAIVDITNLKLAQEAVHELSRKLLNAQENERARLARELHDDLSQSIALLSLQMTRLRDKPETSEYMKDQLDQLILDVCRLAGDLRRISHELHPALLSQLGLESALHGFVHELTAAHALVIDFKAGNLPRNLREDISLCLYRVTQESLQNVIKHSAATSVQVRIKAEHGQIHLSVSDNGNGFDPEAAKAKGSLGLISIDERVRAVKGEAKVISSVGAGTNIEVRVPVGNGSGDGTM